MTPLLYTLAQNADDNARAAGTAVGGLAVGCCFLVVELAVVIIVVAGMWKVFTKAGQPGWAALIPIFNIYILCVIAGRPAWWIILFLIPLVNFIAGIIISLDIAKNFGRSPLFAIGLIFLPFIFYPILGFGNSIYSGPAKSFA